MTPATRLWGATALIALLALSFGVDFYGYTQSAAKEPDPYRISEQMNRFAPAATAVPPAEVIGYASDQPPEASQGQAMYFGAQYALAPRLLTPEWRQQRVRLVLGNFSSPQGLVAFNRQGLELVQDFGSGVVLFRKGEQ